MYNREKGENNDQKWNPRKFSLRLTGKQKEKHSHWIEGKSWGNFLTWVDVRKEMTDYLYMGF